ncbi:MAG: ABC transporter ATP-binding protein [Actinomycetota bacterium]
MRPAIYATGLTVTIDGTRLLGPTSLTVGAGSWVNVIGPNGAGKSTMLRALAGLQTAEGRIELGGTPIGSYNRRARSRYIGFVGQHPTMPAGMTVEQYVLLGRAPHLRPMSAEGPDDFAAVERALAQLELTKLAGRSLETLSGGESQRAALARAFAQEPSLLLLDEPTSALDIGHQQDVLELVDQLRHELGLTVVSTMHDLTLAARYGDHLVMLTDGRVVASGPPVQVLTGPHLAAHYGAAVDVINHKGSLVVVPLRHERPHARRDLSDAPDHTPDRLDRNEDPHA